MIKTIDIIKESYKVNAHIHWTAFTSTSSDFEMAKNFSGNGGVIFKINCNNARSINNYSYFHNESELLLSLNFRCVVKNVSEKNGRVVIELQEYEIFVF